jgi:hypothetical protein
VYPVLAEQMTIKQDVLFSYLIPALLSLFAGVFAFNKDIKISNIFSKIDRKQAVDLGNLLIGVSLFLMYFLFLALNRLCPLPIILSTLE